MDVDFKLRSLLQELWLPTTFSIQTRLIQLTTEHSLGQGQHDSDSTRGVDAERALFHNAMSVT